jgi:hypothetical protein
LKIKFKKLLSTCYFLFLKIKMTEEQIRHLARLSEIQLSDEEVEKMKNEFNELLEFV